MTQKTVRSLALLLALLSMALLLAACGAGAKDVSVDALVTAVNDAISDPSGLTEVDAAYIKGYLKLDVSECEGYSVRINAYGVNIDEYGIFKAKDADQAKEIKAACESYLETRLQSWMDEYMPEEKPKLTNAEVKISGNYVIYCILSDSDRSAAFDAFTQALK